VLGLHCGIYRSPSNISNISYLNSPPPSFSFILLYTHSRNSFNRFHFSIYIHVLYTVFVLYSPFYTLFPHSQFIEFFLVVLGFKLRALYLFGKLVPSCLNHISSPVCCGCFGDGVSLSIKPQMIDACYHAQLFLLRWGSQELFCPGWTNSTILPILTLQVANIAGMNHQCLT
jgi:hypothetical protein